MLPRTPLQAAAQGPQGAPAPPGLRGGLRPPRYGRLRRPALRALPLQACRPDIFYRTPCRRLYFPAEGDIIIYIFCSTPHSKEAPICSPSSVPKN